MSATVPGPTHRGALPCAPRSPVSEGLRVLYGPFCKVEGGVPRDQASGAVGDDGCALRECDRVSRRLGADREKGLIQAPEGAGIKKKTKDHNR